MKTLRPAGPAPARRPRGRPRAFDRDQALARAIEVFWSKGFEAASVADLTAAMGINPPSLYAAFGDKESLFIEAVRRYHENVQMSCPYAGEPTARLAVERLLTELAALFTDRSHPSGCLSVMAMVTSSTTSPRLQKCIAAERAEARARLRERIQRGVKEGDLPRDSDTAALTDFYAAVISGMSLQAREGGTRKALLAMVQTAMRAWPERAKQPVRRKAAAVA
ncbi:MAG TPA: TetR/AcrR family transcriptional regulator [Usitatibacter sp.]|nr:TetR/AcrR family transcriptional regulator [Usitatibacter sp.]